MNSLVSALLALFLAGPLAASPDGPFDGGGAAQPPAAALTGAPQALPKSLSQDSRLWLIVPAATPQQRTAAADAGMSIEEVAPESVGGIGTERTARELRRRGFAVTAQPLDQRFHQEDFPKDDAAFHNYDRLVSELRALAAAAPDLASLLSIGTSLQGRDLYALRLNTSAAGFAASDKPGILFLGTHHAREHLSTEVPLLLAKHLVDNRDKPEIKELLAKRDIYVLPMVNPDGVEYDIREGSYHMHRKNMRPVGDGDFGVDLNRNYGFHWGEGGASADPESDTYRGPSAFSEPETRAVKAFVESRTNLKILLSYHTFSELILYPWGHSYDPLPDDRAVAAYKNMAAAMGKMTGYKPQQSSQLYIASGDTTDWSWGERGIFSFTFELTPKSMWKGGFYPGAGAIASTFRSNIRPALYLIDLADDPYRAASPQLSARESAQSSGGR